MDARESAIAHTPFSSASTATVDEIPDAEKGNMPVDPAGDGLSQEDLKKGERKRGGPVGPNSIIDLNDSLEEFDGPDDPENPRNWSKAKRWGITLAMGLLTFVVSVPV